MCLFRSSHFLSWIFEWDTWDIGIVVFSVYIVLIYHRQESFLAEVDSYRSLSHNWKKSNVFTDIDFNFLQFTKNPM